MEIETASPGKSRPPRLKPEIQDALVRFLTAHMTMAETAQARALEDAKRLVLHMDLSGSVEYWSNVVSGIKWLLSKVSCRHKYLLTLDPDGHDSAQP